MVNGVAGEDVVPAGKPEKFMVTASENPFCPVTEIETAGLEVPKAATTWLGDAATLKSLADRTVKFACAECASAEDVPLAVSVYVPADTVAGTESVTAWLAPAAISNGEAGDVVAPAGNPVSATVTELVNPPKPTIDTVKDELAPPESTEIVAGENAMLKSCVDPEEAGLDPPPQPIPQVAHKHRKTANNGRPRVATMHLLAAICLHARPTSPFPDNWRTSWLPLGSLLGQ
jgi:hypothetical protein